MSSQEYSITYKYKKRDILLSLLILFSKSVIL